MHFRMGSGLGDYMCLDFGLLHCKFDETVWVSSELLPNFNRLPFQISK